MPSELSGLVRLKHRWVLTPDLLFHSLTEGDGMRGKDEARQVRIIPVMISCGCQSAPWECLPLVVSVVETSEALLTRAFQFGPGAHKWDDVRTPSTSNGTCAYWYQTLWSTLNLLIPLLLAARDELVGVSSLCFSLESETLFFLFHLLCGESNSLLFLYIHTHTRGQSSSGYKFVQWASVKLEPHG